MATDLLERTRDLSDFDPFGFDYRDVGSGYYPSLTAQSPVFVELEGIRSAVVSKHAQVAAILRDYRSFSSLRPAHVLRLERIDYFNSKPVMNYSDPPLHNRLRKVVNPVFQPKRVLEMVGHAERLVARQLAAIRPGDTVDIIANITRPVGLELFLTHFLGIPPEDQTVMVRFIDTLKLLDDMELGKGKPQAYLDAWDKGVDYCRQQIELARKGKAATVISLVAEAFDEDLLDDDELMAMMVLLYVGGVSNFVTLAGLGLYYMASEGLTDRVRQDPAVAGMILEEALRLHSPVQSVVRFATQDVELGGKTIPAGTPVYCMLAAACCDPEAWPDPMRFQIGRPKIKEHLALGFGVHTCMGSAVTRATTPTVLTMVAERFPDVRFAEGNAMTWLARPRSRNVGVCELTF